MRNPYPWLMPGLPQSCDAVGEGQAVKFGGWGGGLEQMTVWVNWHVDPFFLDLVTISQPCDAKRLSERLPEGCSAVKEMAAAAKPPHGLGKTGRR